MTPAQFQHAVLDWFDRHGRKDLPWQQDIDPYRVWVSEIMLQQTQVKTVIPYFERFMQRFGEVSALASAEQDEVLHLWTGLGYYSRARNLHETARRITEHHRGIFPSEVERLQQLPGIGRSTAGAIAAIAYRQGAPILDGNVKRVLARFFAVDGYPGQGPVQKQLWALAEQHTPIERVQDYTQGMMDLGATVCTRSKPRCEQCPLSSRCLARQQDEIERYPGKKPRKILPVRSTHMLIIENQRGEILLHKRPPSGIWSGLWIFPEVAQDIEPEHFCRDTLGADLLAAEHWQSYRHSFSHYHLDIQPLHLRVQLNNHQTMEAGRALWYNRRQPQAVGLAAPMKKLMERLSTAP